MQDKNVDRPRILISAFLVSVGTIVMFWLLFTGHLTEVGLILIIISLANTFLIGWRFTELVVLCGLIIIMSGLIMQGTWGLVYIVVILGCLLVVSAILDYLQMIKLSRELKVKVLKITSTDLVEIFKDKEILHRLVLWMARQTFFK